MVFDIQFIYGVRHCDRKYKTANIAFYHYKNRTLPVLIVGKKLYRLYTV